MAYDCMPVASLRPGHPSSTIFCDRSCDDNTNTGDELDQPKADEDGDCLSALPDCLLEDFTTNLLIAHNAPYCLDRFQLHLPNYRDIVGQPDIYMPRHKRRWIISGFRCRPVVLEINHWRNRRHSPIVCGTLKSLAIHDCSGRDALAVTAPKLTSFRLWYSVIGLVVFLVDEMDSLVEASN
uniref:Uncharacterized protein n=1 Tax=Oryza rufipogon TaxID=4529 RepID=A0A0E0P5W5_ORYRU